MFRTSGLASLSLTLLIASAVGGHVAAKDALTHKQIVQLADQAVVYLVARDAVGDEIGSATGFVINGKGHAATSYHVLTSAVTVTAQSRDASPLEVEGVAAVDPDHDLAILKLRLLSDGMRPLPLTLPESIEQGDVVTAVGHPGGYKFTATNGIVSAIRKTTELPEGFQQIWQGDLATTWIQTSAAISGGNSGGPLFNDQGQVIGVNSWTASGQNLGFAVHVQHLMDLAIRASDPEPLPIPGLGIVTDPSVGALLKDLQREHLVFLDALQNAADEREQRRVIADQYPVGKYGRRFLELAQSRPKSPTSVQALVTTCELLKQSDEKEDHERLLDAVSRLQRDHLHDPWMAEASLTLSALPEDAIIDFQKAILLQSHDRAARAAACISLSNNLQARNLQNVATLAENLGDAQPESFALQDRAVEEFGDVMLRGRPVQLWMHKTLEARRTQIGTVAPNIQGMDLDGNEMKLSDLRGKVVVLDFWVDWCPYCRQMYPHHRTLLQKYQPSDFALVGVNADAVERGLEAQNVNHLTWRSWADGEAGQIGTTWGISAYPTVVILDKRGVIRHRLAAVDFETLDSIVQSLLMEDSAALPGDVLPLGSTWRYWDHPTAPDRDWHSVTFDDAAWPQGVAPLGFGLDQATELQHGRIGEEQPLTYCFRTRFPVTNPSALGDVVLSAFFDDGIVVYLNGSEVFRRLVTGDADFTTPAYRGRTNQGRNGSYKSIDTGLLRAGENVLAVEVHQATQWSADLRMDLSLTSHAMGKLRAMLESQESDQHTAALSIASDLGEIAQPLVPLIEPLLNSSDEQSNLRTYATLMSIASDDSKEIQPPRTLSFKAMSQRRELALRLNDESRTVLRRAKLSRDDYRRAYSSTRLANGLWPQAADLLSTQALALHRLGKDGAALTQLEEARRLRGVNVTDCFLAAMVYLRLQEPEQARKMFDEGTTALAATSDKTVGHEEWEPLAAEARDALGSILSPTVVVQTQPSVIGGDGNLH